MFPPVHPVPLLAMAAPMGVSFSMLEEGEDKESKEETEGEEAGRPSSLSGKKMWSFFEELMQQVMERQGAMQQRFLEAHPQA